MWIVGGETFSHSKYMVATLTPDMNNPEVQGIWRLVHAQGEKGPSPRYGHSAVMHDDKVCNIKLLLLKGCMMEFDCFGASYLNKNDIKIVYANR